MSPVRSQRRLVRSLVLGAAAFLATPDLAAQTQRAASPPSRATKVTSVEGITEYLLPNGLRVLLFPDESKATFTVSTTYRAGSAQEGTGETGAAHMLEHIVFKSTAKFPNAQRELGRHGATRNAFTLFDFTTYWSTMPATQENLDFALDLEADRMSNAAVDQKFLDTEYSVVLNEGDSRDNDPRVVMQEQMNSVAYRWHVYHRVPQGNRADITNVPIARLKAFYKKYYQPDNATLVVAGRFDEPKTLALIERKYARIPKPVRTEAAGNLIVASYTVEPPQEGERITYVRRRTNAQEIHIGHRGPPGMHPDFFAFEVLTDVLANGPSSRLNKALVGAKLAASVGGGTEQMKEGSMQYLTARVLADQPFDSARAVFERTLNEARTSTFTVEEVERAKAIRLRILESWQNNPQSMASNLGYYVGLGDWRSYFLTRDGVAKTTPADVQRVAAMYLKPTNRTIGLYVATADPERTELPKEPNLAGMVAGYKGRDPVKPGEAFDASTKNIEARTTRTTLSNGMRLTLLPKRSRGGTVTAQIVLRYGTAESLTGKGQVPALTMYLLNRGTTAFTREQVQDSFVKLKAQTGIGGSSGTTLASIETTRPNFIAALGLMAQQLRNPRLDGDELEKLKKERLALHVTQSQNPDNIAGVLMNRRLTPRPKGHPRYTSLPEETSADINAVTIDAVRALHQEFYSTSAADLTIVGDFDAAEVTAAAEKLFGDWKSSQPWALIERPYMRSDSAFESFETPGKTNAYMQMAQNVAIREDDPDYPALYIGHMLFGGSMQGRLTTRLRETDGMSYSSSSSLSPGSLERSGTWSMQATFSPKDVERVERAMRQELDRVLKDGFSEQEVRSYLPGNVQYRENRERVTDASLVLTLGARRAAGRTMAHDQWVDDKILALTAAQVNAAFRKYIDPKQLVVIRAGDFAKNPPPKVMP